MTLDSHNLEFKNLYPFKDSEVQCLITTDAPQWAVYRGGMTFMAQFEDDIALCAERGNENIKEERVKHYCSTLHVGQPYNEHLLMDDVKLHLERDDVCNGESFSVLITKGTWDYKGYSGSIASQKDHGGGECMVMCTYGFEDEKKKIIARIENLSAEELLNDRTHENMERFMQRLLKLCDTFNQE